MTVLEPIDWPDGWEQVPTELDRDRDRLRMQELAATYTPVNWYEAFAAQPAETEWLYQPMLEAGTVNALFSKPGTGKSLLALEIALSVASSGLSVVYVDDENRATEVTERLRDMGAKPAELDRLVFLSFAGLPPLNTKTGGMHLEAIAVVHEASLVILDTTTRMVAGKENDSDTFLQLYRCSLVPLKGRGMTVLRLDHPGKDEERGQRGSSAKDGDVDTIWRLDKVIEGLEYELHRTKSRSGHGDCTDFRLMRRHDPLRHEWHEMDRSRSAAESGKMAEIVALMLSVGLPADAGRPAVREAMKAKGMSAPNWLVSEAIKARRAVRGQ